ncbi:MAG: DUF488 family protein [Acidimicrobiia bacterium]
MLLSGHLSSIRGRRREHRLTNTIWTIGHGERSFDDIERDLATHGISLIVDVRRDPDTPKTPDFSRRRLEERAAEAGIGYRWMGATLGRQSLSEDSGAIDDLIALATVSPIVILGGKPDPDACHRSTVLAPALQARDVAVVHILADGSIRRHESPLPFDR